MNEIHAQILDSINRGASFQEVLEIILDCKRRGITQQATFDALEAIWQEMGCQFDEDSSACGILGGMMDRVWGYCSSKDAIWDVSLSGQVLRPYEGKILH